MLGFCDALARRAPESIAKARGTVVEEMGQAAMVDALGVASNFERMIRIADATGLELGDSLSEFSEDIREDLRIERPAGWSG